MGGGDRRDRKNRADEYRDREPDDEIVLDAQKRLSTTTNNSDSDSEDATPSPDNSGSVNAGGGGGAVGGISTEGTVSAETSNQSAGSSGKDGDNSFGDWEDFEHGDEKFLEYGDRVEVSTDEGEVTGEIVQDGDDNLFGVETEDSGRITIESWDISRYQSRKDDLDDIRGELRDHFEDMGVGTNSKALESYTDDSKYGEYQDQLRSGSDVAKQSPMYDDHPQMETVSAILSTTDEQTADQLKQIQSWAESDLPSDITVHRGIEVDADEFLNRAEQAQRNGNRLMDEGFQSATIDENVTDSFGNVTLDIQTDHGVYLRAASQHAGEDEVLLPAGTQFEVKDIDRETKTVGVEAHEGFDFGAVDVGHIRDLMRDDGLSYPEAVNHVL